jgi:hypothetical protein
MHDEGHGGTDRRAKDWRALANGIAVKTLRVRAMRSCSRRDASLARHRPFGLAAAGSPTRDCIFSDKTSDKTYHKAALTQCHPIFARRDFVPTSTELVSGSPSRLCVLFKPSIPPRYVKAHDACPSLISTQPTPSISPCPSLAGNPPQ